MFTCFNKMYWMSVNDSIKIFFFSVLKDWAIACVNIFFKEKSEFLYDKCVQSGTFIQWHVSLSASFLMPVLRMNERYLKLRLFLIRPASLVFTQIINDMTHFICIWKFFPNCFNNYSISLCYLYWLWNMLNTNVYFSYYLILAFCKRLCNYHW